MVKEEILKYLHESKNVDCLVCEAVNNSNELSNVHNELALKLQKEAIKVQNLAHHLLNFYALCKE